MLTPLKFYTNWIKFLIKKNQKNLKKRKKLKKRMSDPFKLDMRKYRKRVQRELEEDGYDGDSERLY